MSDDKSDPAACIPAHDGGPTLRPHGTPGWWQVWSGGICVALLRPEDVAVIRRETVEACADWLDQSEDLDVVANRMRKAMRGSADG